MRKEPARANFSRQKYIFDNLSRIIGKTECARDGKTCCWAAE